MYDATMGTKIIWYNNEFKNIKPTESDPSLNQQSCRVCVYIYIASKTRF